MRPSRREKEGKTCIMHRRPGSSTPKRNYRGGVFESSQGRRQARWRHIAVKKGRERERGVHCMCPTTPCSVVAPQTVEDVSKHI